jgi:ADP-heptose:LPS heptosyltransferase
VHLFLLGRDYHLGDLLWFTAVLAAYRRRFRPHAVLVGCPDLPISRILEHNPAIDEVRYGEGHAILAAARARLGASLVVHDLRALPIAAAMVSQWGHRRPWLYYRDLWLEPRGQWLATFLRLGHLEETRPILCLTEDDRAAARALAHNAASPVVALAPAVGRYTAPILGTAWRHLKAWGDERWRDLADALRADGYTPVTLGAVGQAAIRGTTPLIGLPIRKAAGVLEQAAALVTVESGLWYVAAALERPVVVVPWWLPRSVDWLAPMRVPYRLIPRDQASVDHVLAQIHEMVAHGPA